MLFFPFLNILYFSPPTTMGYEKHNFTFSGPAYSGAHETKRVLYSSIALRPRHCYVTMTETVWIRISSADYLVVLGRKTPPKLFVILRYPKKISSVLLALKEEQITKSASILPKYYFEFPWLYHGPTS